MRVFTLTVVLFLAMVNGTPYNDCSYSPDILQSIDVSGCDQESVCGIKRGQEARINITFVPDKPLGQVKAQVYGVIGGMEIQFPYGDSIADACVDSGLRCPVSAGQPHHYVKKLMVNLVFPRMSVVIKWVLKDQHDESVVCAEIPARLQ